MDKRVKIFSRNAEQDSLATKYTIIEKYPGFVVAEVTQADIVELSKKYPVEDITEQYQLKIGDKTIDTSTARLDIHAKPLKHPSYQDQKKLTAGSHHHLIQFIGPIKEEWLDALKKLGATPRAPMQAFTYVVLSDDKTLAKIIELPFVRWAGHLSHDERIATSVLSKAGRKVNDVGAELPRTKVLPGTFVVEFFGAKELKASIAEIKKIGFTILEKASKSHLLIIQDPKSGAGTLKRIHRLSAVHGVRYIRERSLKRTSNNVAADIMGTEFAMSNGGLDLSGQGEIIGVCDTGLDTADLQSIHPDFKGRISGITSYPITADLSLYINNPGGDDGAQDLDSGHGTHVAGSVLGDGSVSSQIAGVTAPIRGLAHRAKLYFQAVEQEMQWKDPENFQRYGRYLLTGIPNDLTDLFSDAYNNNVRIHSNSWGGGDPGVYDIQCEQLDRFVWNNKDFCILFANGNDGTDADADGVINAMSVTAPASAKNCISVGACENERSEFNAQTYGNWWPQDYPVAPYNNDPMANNAAQVVAFSSRGPTADGRIKPDVVAPGTFILSTRSTRLAANNMAWAAYPPSKAYFHMGGTSMATPLVAGAVGLIREYLRIQQGINNPTAALLKSALIHGAARLPSAMNAAVADNDQGFGKVDLDAVLNPALAGNATFVDIKPGLRTGEVHALEISVQSSMTPLKVTMVYSDYPGSALVNNLNLMLTSPDGSRYLGNQVGSNNLVLDNKNNVEKLNIVNPLAGTWLVEIVASNVPQGPQDFALVYSAHIGEASTSEFIQVESEPNLAIPDNAPNGISSTINISSTDLIGGVKVGVDITHSYIGDLKLTLSSPEQTTVTLHDRWGASENDLVKFYDLQNTAELAQFRNQSINGDWTLHVSDHANKDEGLLNRWSLEIMPAVSRLLEIESSPFTLIPDNNPQGVRDTIMVNESGTLQEIEITLDITHTWISDLIVELISPSGESVILHQRSGGSLDNIIKRFDLTNLPALSNFVGLQIQGEWGLIVSDHAGRDIGKLNKWKLGILY